MAAPARSPSSRWLAAAMLLVMCALHAAAPAADAPLRLVVTKHYDVHTSVADTHAKPIAAHMDAVFDEYAKRFRALSSKQNERMPLYLFRTQEEYQAFMRQQGIDASATGGVFFVTPKLRGLATFVEGRPSSITLETLQHEGFHQFAHIHIGPRLPVWVNEGLAEYFGDAILVDGSLRIGVAVGRRIESNRQAIRDGKVIDFDKLMAMQPGQWHATLIRDKDRGRLQYDQSWAMVHFLIHAEDGRYRPPFEDYLSQVARGVEHGKAFKQSFGAEDATGYRKLWERYMAKLEPDPLDTAVSRMKFLAHGLLILQQRREPPPLSIDELRRRLTELGFKATRIENGIRTEVAATDAALYLYARDGGGYGPFELLSPAAATEPPRVTAKGIQPTPTIRWTRDGEGTLVAEVSYK